MQVELRNNPRFKVKKQPFAGLIGPESKDIFQLGQIVNIGKGGVCLQYIITETREDAVSHISIFGRTDKFFNIEKIPCKMVYDISIPTKGWIHLPEKRCGIAFLSQSSSQKKQIESFIKSFAINHDAKPRPTRKG
ncbi:MAG TPA: hypothetical protein VEF33_12310 [Syntrophales bacterium]|nr:hypothetical protein [Syntrophales bacterium]